jgi:hypothetical protein
MERKSFKIRIKSFSLVKPNLTGHQLYNSETIQGRTSTLQKTSPLQVLNHIPTFMGCKLHLVHYLMPRVKQKA